MNHRFKLQVIRVQCVHEAALEWGEDELHMIGYGINKKGSLFATGYRNLGSFHEGEVSTTGILPLTLFEGEFPDDGLDVLLFFWFVEEDGGGVGSAAAALETEFRNAYQVQATNLAAVQFPRDCIAYTAFYKAVIPFEKSVLEAATDGLNDEVYAPCDLLLRYAPDGATALKWSKDVTVERSKNLGHYRVTFRYSYSKIPVVIE